MLTFFSSDTAIAVDYESFAERNENLRKEMRGDKINGILVQGKLSRLLPI